MNAPAHPTGHAAHPAIVKRLHCAEGHLRGVIAMIEEGRPCLDLAQQPHAIERAMAEAERTLIQDHLDHCLDAAADGPAVARREAVAEFRAIAKFF